MTRDAAIVYGRLHKDINWTRWYSKNKETPVISHGVFTPESDMSNIEKREQLREHLLKHKFVLVCAEHPVMDIIKRLDILGLNNEQLEKSNMHQTGWYKVASNLFEFCMIETKKLLAIIKIQRCFRSASWRSQMPSLKNVKAFDKTTVAVSLPDDVVRKIVVQYFKN